MAGLPLSHFFLPHTTLVRGQRVTEMAADQLLLQKFSLGLRPVNFAQPSMNLQQSFCFAYMFAVRVRSM